MTNLVGHTLLNRYRVLALIGAGGMADVYKAHDQLRNAELALKVLKPDLAQDGSFVRHFREEAEALMALDHPNIVRFYSIERDGDIFFIVMDYVEGITLREEMQARSGRLGNERIARVMRGVCAALEYAHKSGYVHRDIKPTNILIGNNQVFLTDFGIARLTGSASSTLGKVGTPGYMSPEQIRGETTSPASDIYSLGVLLYEMVVGTRPFTGQSMQTTGSTSERVRWEQLNLSPPAPRRLNPSISPYLERIILRCLEKDPALRFSSVAELWSAFEQSIPRHAALPLQNSTPPKKTLSIFSPKNRNKLYVLVLLFLFSVGGCKAEFAELGAMLDTSAATTQLTKGREISRWSQDRETDPLLGKPKQPELRIEYEPINNYTKEDVFDEIVEILKNDGWVSNTERSGYFTASLPQEYFTIMAEVLVHSKDNIVSVDFVTIPR